jgi:hypothetical protein
VLGLATTPRAKGPMARSAPELPLRAPGSGTMARVSEKDRWPRFGSPQGVRLVPLIVVAAVLLYVRFGAAGLGIGLGVALVLIGVIAWSLRRPSPTSSDALFSQRGGLRVTDIRNMPSVSDQASVESRWADQGYLLGTIHVTSEGLRWEPNGRLRRRGARTVELPWSQVSSVRLRPLKGIGDGVGADFFLSDGRPLGVWTAKPKALAEALRMVGVAVEAGT